MHQLAFNYKKSTQALNYFAVQNGGMITKLCALKLIYFADRYHLRKYGRPITNDQYWAMQFGPVASSVKEISELDSLSGTERHYAEHFIGKGQPEEGEQYYDIKSINPVDNTVFSESDLEALAFVWNEFGRNLPHLVDITHQYPEWKRHAAALDGGQSRMQMDYMDFFDDPDSKYNPCWPLSDEEKQLRREQLRELNELESVWR